MLCEIGGTIGDIEGLPFYEAIRQFAHDRPNGQCAFLHLTLVPFIEACNELKTKPTQHSVKELRSIGISPDVLVCRSSAPLPEKERSKIALFCNVRSEDVVSAPNLNTIYDAPLAYHDQGLDDAVLRAFGVAPLPSRTCRLGLTFPNESTKRKERLGSPSSENTAMWRTPTSQSRKRYATGGIANKIRVKSEVILSEVFEEEDPTPYLEQCHAILIPGGFGDRGIEGKIKAAGFARERKVPFLGICLGMQMAVIEAVRNLLGIENAGSEEFENDEGIGDGKFDHVVYYMGRWMKDGETIIRRPGDGKGATMRLGAYPAMLEEGSKAASIYGATEISERHRHRYEIDTKYRSRLEKHGVRFSGMSPDGLLPEILEITDHPWFIGVQFPSGVEVSAVRSSSSVCGFRTRGDQAGSISVISRFRALIRRRILYPARAIALRGEL